MIQPLFLGGIGMQEILVIMLVILLFYGGKKVPEMMRGLGQGVKAFKEGMNESTPKGETPTPQTTNSPNDQTTNSPNAQ